MKRGDIRKHREKRDGTYFSKEQSGKIRKRYFDREQRDYDRKNGMNKVKAYGWGLGAAIIGYISLEEIFSEDPNYNKAMISGGAAALSALFSYLRFKIHKKNKKKMEEYEKGLEDKVSEE